MLTYGMKVKEKPCIEGRKPTLLTFVYIIQREAFADEEKLHDFFYLLPELFLALVKTLNYNI